MKNKLLTVLAVAFCVFGVVGMASAATIYSGTIINDSGFYGSYPSNNAINQSGLSSTYTSGVTDFDTYAASAPTHLGSSSSTAGALDNSPAFIDFNFGQAFNFTDFGLWNDNDYQGIKDFNLYVANNSSFTGATLLGSFTATYGPSDYSNPVALQTFDLIEASGQYLRLNLLNNHLSGYVNFGEVIFGAEAPAPVPEPATILLLGAGLIGLAGVNSRRKKQA